jgi:hypothetical protein
MATRMQQRRGLAAQWTAANPVLAAGEIGFETDTSKFKMGNGTSTWSELVYFANATELQAAIDSVVGMSPESLDTLAEIAASLGDNPDFLSALATNARVDGVVLAGTASVQQASNAAATALDNHSGSTQGIHGIADTAELATKVYANTAVSDHNLVTTNVHGIANTTLLATLNNVSTAKQEAIDTAVEQSGDIADDKITDFNTQTTDVHGIANTQNLATLNNVSDSITSHNSATTGVHGIEDTADLALLSNVSDAVDAHNSATLGVHGITNTALLATTANVATAKGEAISEAGTEADAKISTAIGIVTAGLTNVDNTADVDKPVSTAQATAIGTAKTEAIADAGTAADGKISAHNLETENVHGIPDTTVLVTQTELSNAITGVTVDQSALAGTGLEWDIVAEQFTVDSTIATKTYADDAVSAHNDETENVHGISDTSQLAYKNAANQTFTGNMEVDGNLVVDGDFTVNGTNFSASATSITIEDNMLQLAHQNAANTVDLGLVVAYNDGAAKHSGLVRDVSDAKWKLFKGVTTEPSTVVAFGEGSLDALAVGALEATTVTPSSGIVFSDGTQTKVGVPSITAFATEITSSATLAAGEADKFVPLNGAVTITLPSSGYSTGQSIDFYQATGTGAQFSDANGVVGTPGRKFRTTYSVVTAMKTPSGWLIFGDLAV